ncbi:MAG: hypothetical protein LBC77_06095 [Spirochaetaceae bacterium]|jgi:hypothetical protein|nr:hypothetical protein [Spirochaetaceae bacterium]
MNRFVFCFVLFLYGVELFAADTGKAGMAFAKNFGFTAFWSGLWHDDDYVSERAEAIFTAPFSISLRAQLLDKRPVPPWLDWSAGKTEIAGAVYHKDTGSRFVYGHLETWGLAARTRNVWIRGIPWFETHKPSGADLKTTVSSTGNPAYFLAAGSPEFIFGRENAKDADFFGISGNAAMLFSEDYSLFTNAAGNFQFGKNHKLRLEWFLSEKKVPPRKQSGWFSDKPAMPARNMRLFAISTVYQHKFFGFSADFAHSELFLHGRDIYINTAVRFGDRPWRLSFAADGAGVKFTGSNGGICGAGFRSAGKLEWFGAKTMHAFIETRLSADKLEGAFKKSFSRAAFYFPVIRGAAVAPTRIVLDAERNAYDNEKILDTLTAVFGFKCGAVRPVFRISLTEKSSLNKEISVVPYPIISSEREFTSLKAGIEIGVPISFLLFTGALTYRKDGDDEPEWDKSISVNAKGKWGRISLRFYDDDGEFSYAVSWRFEVKI